MLSKCANPECSERFMYLGRGKLFHLTPTPDLEAIGGESVPLLYERFWLCEECSKKMTLIWGGTEAKLVSLPKEPVAAPGTNETMQETRQEVKRSAASAGLRRR
jgi:hypothetical protein